MKPLATGLCSPLNIQRDLISRQINCPLLFWVSNFALTVIAREAPDLYDFRHTVFNFKAMGEGEPSTMGDPILWDHFPALHPAGSSERWTAYLLDQLARYHKDDSRLQLRDKLAYAELLQEVARNEKNCPEARIYLERALSIYEELHEKRWQAVVLHHIADIDYYTGNPMGAENSLAKALSLYRDIEDRLGEANVLQSLGDVQLTQDAYAEAEQLYSKAVEIYASIDDKYSKGETLLSLAEVYRALGDQEKARSFADQA